MRKTIVAATFMLTILTLMAIKPVINAEAFFWDGVRFVEEGMYIKYTHPDRNHYEISPYSDWGYDGGRLHHHQLDRDTSKRVVDSLPLTMGVLGACLGAKIGSKYGVPICSVIGTVLGFVLTWVAEPKFLDEHSCIWWWISLAFVDWLDENAWWLEPLCIVDWLDPSPGPALAFHCIMTAFYSVGYLRVGSVTFYDSLGIGGPDGFTLIISLAGGGITYPSPGTYEYEYGTSVTVTAFPDPSYTMYWIFHGEAKYGNSITVTMNCSHTLTAYFRPPRNTYRGGGGRIHGYLKSTS